MNINLGWLSRCEFSAQGGSQRRENLVHEALQPLAPHSGGARKGRFRGRGHRFHTCRRRRLHLGRCGRCRRRLCVLRVEHRGRLCLHCQQVFIVRLLLKHHCQTLAPVSAEAAVAAVSTVPEAPRHPAVTNTFRPSSVVFAHPHHGLVPCALPLQRLKRVDHWRRRRRCWLRLLACPLVRAGVSVKTHGHRRSGPWGLERTPRVPATALVAPLPSGSAAIAVFVPALHGSVVFVRGVGEGIFEGGQLVPELRCERLRRLRHEGLAPARTTGAAQPRERGLGVNLPRKRSQLGRELSRSCPQPSHHRRVRERHVRAPPRRSVLVEDCTLAQPIPFLKATVGVLHQTSVEPRAKI